MTEANWIKVTSSGNCPPLKYNTIAMILYKYYACHENTYKSLAMQGLWCHYPKNMNDPFECLAQVQRKLDKEKIKEFREYVAEKGIRISKYLKANDDKSIENFFNRSRLAFISKWAFCSLAETYDDILMWSYYTNGHKGFVMGFEFDNFDNNLIFQRVSYRDTLNTFDLIRWADFVSGDDSFLSEFLRDISVKSVVWEKEREWRIWRNAPQYYHYQPHEVKEVYFGINCEEQTKALIFQLLNVPEDFVFYEMEFRDNPIRLSR